MITEAIQATELSQMKWMEKQKNVKKCENLCAYIKYIYIYIYIYIFAYQKSVLLIVHNSQR